MKISIIVCVYNNPKVTRVCLDSLQKYVVSDGIEVLVIDDASTDDTPQVLPAEYPWTRFLRHEPNQGYGGACTWGVSHAKGDYVLLLNNDTEAEDDFVAPLLERLESSPKIGMVAGRMLYPDRTLQHAGVAFCEERAPYHIYRCFAKNFPPALKARRFQALNGASAFMPRKLFEELQGFSPDFRNGFEDIDQCLRLGQMGYEIWYEPKACLLHYESQSPRRHEHEDRNRKRFLDTWGDKIHRDEYEIYEDHGLPSVLWPHLQHLAHFRRPEEEMPFLWNISPSTDPRVRQALSDFQETMARELAWKIRIESVSDSFSGAIGVIRGNRPALSMRVYLSTQPGPAPAGCHESWLLTGDSVRSPRQRRPMTGVSLPYQLLKLSLACPGNTPDGLLQRGRHMLHTRPGDVPAYLAEFEQTFPGQHEPSLLAGDLYWLRGEFKTALAHYQKSIIEPEYVSLRVAECLRRDGAGDQARQRIHNVLRRKPFHMGARWMQLRTLWT